MSRPKKNHQEDNKKHEGQGVEHVDKTHHETVGKSAGITRDGTPGDADDDGDQRRGKTDGQRYAPAIENPHHQIAAIAVGAQDMTGAKIRW